MKIRSFFLLLLAVTTLSMIACKKGFDKAENKWVSLDVTLARGTSYQLDLSQYGDADDIAGIATQATDYITSEVIRDAASSRYIYKYSTNATPKVSSTGHDVVVLKVNEPGGCRGHHGETTITINFTLQ